MPSPVLPSDLARQDICRFLAACFYEPTADFVEADLFGSLKAVADALDPELRPAVERLEKAFAADDLQTLLVDHTRLFIGPSRPLAIPYGSFWLAGDTSLMHDPAFSVTGFYDEGGFELDESFRDLPDHVAVELEFLYVLFFGYHQALLAGDDTGARERRALRQRFLEAHLGKWVPAFAAAIREHAKTGFYQALADLTERVVRKL